MHLPCLIVYAAICIKAVALVLFLRQRKMIPRWVMWNLSAMFVVMMIRMWMLAEDYYDLAKFASMFIALEVLYSVVYCGRVLRKTRKEFAEMDQQNKSLAHQLAEHLAYCRREIQYYEDHAARTGHPFFKDRAGK